MTTDRKPKTRQKASMATSTHRNRLHSSATEEPLYPDIVLYKGKVCEKKKTGDEVSYAILAPRIEVKEVRIDRETKKHWLVVDFDGLDGPSELVIDRGHLKRSHLLDYQQYGLPANEINASGIIRHLINQEQQAPKVFMHSQPGWAEHEGSLVFNHHVSYGLPIPSRYEGELAIQPHGDEKDWMEAIREHVVGRPPLELALCCGLSAPVVGLIGSHVGLPSLLIHAYGNSSQGKTTAAMLAVSPFGNPSPLVNGLHASWNATDNALLGRLIGNRGVPVALDESSTDPSRDFTALIYRLAGGTDKGRLNRDSHLKERGTWSTTIFSTGEASLLKQAKRNAGLRMRLLEFGNVAWTDSAPHADALRNAILDHYGQAGPRFANALRELGRAQVLDTFRAVHQESLQRLAAIGVHDDLVHRGAIKIALLLTTARFVPEVLGLELDVEGLWDFALRAEQASARERNLPQQAYEFFQEQIARHRSCFEWHASYDADLKLDVSSGRGELWGKVTETRDSVEVAILRHKFDDLLREGGFTDSSVILEAWKKEGLLNHEDGHLTRQRTLQGIRQRMYVVRLPKATRDEESEEFRSTSPVCRRRKRIVLQRK